MSARLILTALMVLAALPAPAWARGPRGGPKKDVQACLVRPKDAIEGQAQATLRLRVKTLWKSKTVRQRIDLVARFLEPAEGYDLLIEHPPLSGVMEHVGRLLPLKSTFRYRVDTKGGEALPFQVLALEKLAGRRVEVRELDGGPLLLHGTVPAFGQSPKTIKGKATLLAPGEDQAGAKATVRLRAKWTKGHQKIVVRAKKVLPDASGWRVFLETALDSGVFEDEGALELKGAKGSYFRDCKKGDPLPGGTVRINALSGRRMEIRDASGSVQLSGVVPAMK